MLRRSRLATWVFGLASSACLHRMPPPSLPPLASLLDPPERSAREQAARSREEPEQRAADAVRVVPPPVARAAHGLVTAALACLMGPIFLDALGAPASDADAILAERCQPVADAAGIPADALASGTPAALGAARSMLADQARYQGLAAATEGALLGLYDHGIAAIREGLGLRQRWSGAASSPGNASSAPSRAAIEIAPAGAAARAGRDPLYELSKWSLAPEARPAWADAKALVWLLAMDRMLLGGPTPDAASPRRSARLAAAGRRAPRFAAPAAGGPPNATAPLLSAGGALPRAAMLLSGAAGALPSAAGALPSAAGALPSADGLRARGIAQLPDGRPGAAAGPSEASKGEGGELGWLVRARATGHALAGRVERELDAVRSALAPGDLTDALAGDLARLRIATPRR